MREIKFFLGFIWEEFMELVEGGLDEYLHDMWNVIGKFPATNLSKILS